MSDSGSTASRSYSSSFSSSYMDATNASTDSTTCMHCCACFHNVLQVCAYRCITSYETKAMEQFSLCVMQKNNCMDNSATIPTSPDPQPAVQFRGAPLTFEAAEVSTLEHYNSNVHI
jgi:VDE lipocalin domain